MNVKGKATSLVNANVCYNNIFYTHICWLAAKDTDNLLRSCSCVLGHDAIPSIRQHVSRKEFVVLFQYGFLPKPQSYLVSLTLETQFWGWKTHEWMNELIISIYLFFLLLTISQVPDFLWSPGNTLAVMCVKSDKRCFLSPLFYFCRKSSQHLLVDKSIMLTVNNLQSILIRYWALRIWALSNCSTTG